MASLKSGTTIGGYTAIHTNNISSYALTSAPSVSQLISPNGATVVGADQAMPNAGHSFIHTLALGPGNNDGHILSMTWAGTTSIYGAQIFIDTDPNDIMAIRSRSSTGVWTSWKTIIHSGTIGSQSVNYANSAGSVAWGNVSSKPSYIMYYQGFTLDANTMDTNSTGFTYANNAPFYGPIARFSTGGGYDLWLGGSYIGGSSFYLRTRNGDNGTFNAWREIIHSGNIASQSVNYANSAGDSTNLGGLSSSRFPKQDYYYSSSYNWDTIEAADTTAAIVLRIESAVSNPPAGDVYNWSLWQQGTRSRGSQIAVSAYGTQRMYFRGSDFDSGSYRPWSEIIHSGNIGSYALTSIPSTISPNNIYIGNAIYFGGANNYLNWTNNRIYSNVGIEAPIFYDSNDTGYYLDPNGTSNLLQLTTATRARWNMPRVWYDRSSRTSDQGYWTGTNGWGAEDGTWANAWKGGFSGWDIWGYNTDHPQGGGYVHAQGIVSGQHYATSSVGYGWMMVGAANATDNRYWLRGKWDTTTSSWVEMITTGNYSSYVVPKTGGSFTGGIGGTTFDFGDGGYIGGNTTIAGRLTVNAWTTSQRNYSYEWIELPNYSGLYSPINGAHFYPNNASYGAWKIAGSRNGWNGIEFDGATGNVSLMASSNTTGFHNNSYGWQFYWDNGTLYCHKNSYGAGTQATVLDSSNFTNWAAAASHTHSQYFDKNTLAPVSVASDVVSFYYDVSAGNKFTAPRFLVNSHSDNTKGYRIYNTSSVEVSAMFVNSSNQLVIAAGAVDQVNLNKKVLVNGVALGVNVAPSATAGRIDASNDIVAYSSSDERLKENITPIENALDKVKSLTGVEFDWKPEYKHAHGYEGHDTGIIAQQVEAVMPSAVRTNDTGFLAVRYEKLIGLLIEGMKEQQAQIDELKAKLDGLTK